MGQLRCILCKPRHHYPGFSRKNESKIRIHPLYTSSIFASIVTRFCLIFAIFCPFYRPSSLPILVSATNPIFTWLRVRESVGR